MLWRSRAALTGLAALVACAGERAEVEHPRAEDRSQVLPETPPALGTGAATSTATGTTTAATADASAATAATNVAAEPASADSVDRPVVSAANLTAASPDRMARTCPDEADAPAPLAAVIAGATGPRWTAEPVQGPFRYGPDDGLALVAIGRDDVLVTGVATGSGLVAARWRHGRWTAEIVDPAAGRGDTSVVRDSRGSVHVSYRSQEGALRHAWQQDGGWRTESIDTSGHLAESNALAIDRRDGLTVAYYDEDRKLLKVARRRAGGRWTFEVVGHGGGQWTLEVSIGLDRQGRAHVIYSDADARTVRHAARDETGWTSEILDTRLVQGHTSIAFDAQGHPVVAYYDTGASELVVARWTGACWRRRVVVRALEVSGGWPSLAIGADDRVHVAYFQGTREGTQYVVGQGDRWTIETIDAGADSAPWVGLALDPAGRPFVAHGNGRGPPRFCVR